MAMRSRVIGSTRANTVQWRLFDADLFAELPTSGLVSGRDVAWAEGHLYVADGAASWKQIDGGGEGGGLSQAQLLARLSVGF